MLENNYHKETKDSENSVIVKDKKCHYIDLTKDSPKKLSRNQSKNNDGVFDMETISSVESWTSSSDDILCTNNRVIN